jgi:hypothetical protein
VAAAVARSLHVTFDCERYVFLSGHLGSQLERVLPAYLDGLDLEFIEDHKQRGTASAVWDALETLQLSEFVYSHGNVLVGSESLSRVAEHASATSALAVSDDSQAGTHPRVLVGNGSVVEGIAAPGAAVRSVGMAVYRDVPGVKKWNRPAADAPVESMMLQGRPRSMVVKAIDIGNDWRHLEDLNFYA